MNKLLPSFIESAARSTISLVKLNKTVTIITGVLIPTIVGVFCTYYEPLMKTNPLLFWFPVIVLVGLAIIYAAYTWDTPLPAEALVQYLDASNQASELAGSVRCLMTLQELVYVWRSMTDEYVEHPIDNTEDCRNAVRVLMESMVNLSANIFEFAPQELWNFAIYIYDAAQDELVPIWRDKHRSHPSGAGMGRSWKPGVGHIGLAFSQGEARITPNARLPGVVDLLRLPQGQARPYDESVYVSLMSEPIRGPEGGTPWGVVVATSNVPGRFNELRGLALRHVAAEIGRLLGLGYEGPMPP
jgi:hypothetical protein